MVGLEIANISRDGLGFAQEKSKHMLQDFAGFARYRETRALTERLCEPLITEDYGVQPVLEVSPPKWHLAHTTWFFEHFLLMRNCLQESDLSHQR